MMNKKVTIGIATYNHANFLEKAILSALNQTYHNIEIIVVDDCSTDNTQEIVSKLNNKSEKLKFFKNNGNLGIVGNYNKIIDLASGEYITILGDDDYLANDYIEKMILLFLENPNCKVAFGQNVIIDSKGNVIKKLISNFLKLPYIDYVKYWLSGSKIINQHSVIMMFVSKSEVLKAGKFPDFPMAQHADNALFLNMAINGDICYNKSALYYYRVYAESYGNKNVIEVAYSSTAFMNYFQESISKNLIKFYDYNTTLDISSLLKKALTKEFNSRVAKFYSQNNSFLKCTELIFNAFPNWKEKYLFFYDFIIKYIYTKFKK
ncbi:MAG: glycosyltransferase family 2 protein [Bacteroidetes bacterium]|nr:MAG: glycosyltransferase family 2 protein [Bacteroidota bacterium]